MSLATKKKPVLLVVIGAMGAAITAATVMVSTSPDDRLGVIVASCIAAVTAGGLVTLFRQHIHPTNPPISGRERLLGPIGALSGVVMAMLLPDSSLDPVILGSITGGLLLVVYWSPRLGR